MQDLQNRINQFKFEHNIDLTPRFKPSLVGFNERNKKPSVNLDWFFDSTGLSPAIIEKVRKAFNADEAIEFYGE